MQKSIYSFKLQYEEKQSWGFSLWESHLPYIEKPWKGITPAKEKYFFFCSLIILSMHAINIIPSHIIKLYSAYLRNKVFPCYCTCIDLHLVYTWSITYVSTTNDMIKHKLLILDSQVKLSFHEVDTQRLCWYQNLISDKWQPINVIHWQEWSRKKRRPRPLVIHVVLRQNIHSTW